MIVCVTGGRHCSNRAALFRELDTLHVETPITLIVQGYCEQKDPATGRYVPSGADKLAMDWAESRGVPHTGRQYRADWFRSGKFERREGPLRNGRMLRETQPTHVLACPGGAGTADCVRQAEGMEIPVRLVPEIDS